MTQTTVWTHGSRKWLPLLFARTLFLLSYGRLATSSRLKLRSICGKRRRHDIAPCFRRRPYHVEYTGSLPTSEVKRRRARLVLGWGTAWEHLRVSSAFARINARATIGASLPPARENLLIAHMKWGMFAYSCMLECRDAYCIQADSHRCLSLDIAA